jgi:hypothetical protein
MRGSLTLALAMCMTMASLAGCGGGGGGPAIDPNSGLISGTVTIDGPFAPDVDLQLGLLLGGSYVVEQHDLGRVPSTTAAAFIGQDLHYTFSQLFVSTYNVIVFTDVGESRRYWFQSAPVTLGFASTTANHVDGAINFTGAAPYGSIAGTVVLSGEWPATDSVFIGVTPQGSSAAPLRWLVQSGDAAGGSLAYKVPDLAYGTYSLGLYEVDSHGAVSTLGTAADSFTVAAGAPDVTAADFSAGFGN